MFYLNFIPYIALQVNDHHELHAIAVRLGMNEYQFAAVLGAVSNNLLTKRFFINKKEIDDKTLNISEFFTVQKVL